MEATDGPICSAACVITKPAEEWPTRTMSFRSSHLIRLTTSLTRVVRLTPLVKRCDRPHSPVNHSAQTLGPLLPSASTTRRQHQPPCQVPCTSTKVFREV